MIGTVLEALPEPKVAAVDRNHALFIASVVLAAKPRAVIELGVGTAYLTWTLLDAIRYNGVGALAVVDNWFDAGGKEPVAVTNELRAAGVMVLTASEEEFVHAAPDACCDVLISDADHYATQRWVDQHLRILTSGGWLFYHDTNNPSFPMLAEIEPQLRDRGAFVAHFTQSSRPGERCERGLLVGRKPIADAAK